MTVAAVVAGMMPHGPVPSQLRPPPPNAVSCFGCRRVKKLCDKKLPCSRGRPWGSTKRKSPPRESAEAGGASTRRLPSPLPSSGPMRLGVRPEIVYGSLVQAVDGLTALASRSALHSSGPLRSLMGLAGGRDPSEPSPLALFMNKADPGLNAIGGLPGASASAFETIVSTLRQMRIREKLNQAKVDTTRQSIECLFPNRNDGFQGNEMLRAMLPVIGARTSEPDYLLDPTLSEAGAVWAKELLTTPDTFTMVAEYSEVHLQVTCNDLMSRLVVTSEELFQEAVATQSLPAVVFAAHLRPDCIRDFYEAVTECQYSKGRFRERNCVVQVRLRTSGLVSCLATCRSHWRPHMTIVTMRLWPLDLLLQRSAPVSLASSTLSGGMDLSASSSSLPPLPPHGAALQQQALERGAQLALAAGAAGAGYPGEQARLLAFQQQAASGQGSYALLGREGQW